MQLNFPISNDESLIRKTIKDYVEGYLDAERSLLEKSFYSETVLYSVNQDTPPDTIENLEKTEMNAWLNNLDQRKLDGDIRKAELKIDFIDISANAAMAKLNLIFESFQFTDYLSLLKRDSRWKIVGKIYAMTK